MLPLIGAKYLLCLCSVSADARINVYIYIYMYCTSVHRLDPSQYIYYFDRVIIIILRYLDDGRMEGKKEVVYIVEYEALTLHRLKRSSR